MALTTITSGGLGDNSVDTDQLAASAVETAKINNDAVTLAKMASGTDGAMLTYDADGNPVAITGTDGQVATSAGAGAVSAFEAGGVSNVPAFMVQLSVSQTDIEYATYTKILFDEEIWDTNTDFASNKFTPTVAGNYFIGVNVYLSDIPDARYLATVIYKNGSSAFLNRAHSSQNQEIACYTSAIIAMNGSSDYIEGYGAHNDAVAKSFIGGRSYASTYMFGFLIA